MRHLAIAIVALCLTGCGLVEVREPEAVATLRQEVEAATSARAHAERQADAAVKTSAEAREAAAKARQEAEAARALADEKDGQVRRLDRLADQLRNQEVAGGIRRASWWAIAAGGLALVAGIVLAVWLQAPFALRVAACGGAVIAVGLVGLWLAPHWLWVAWLAGGIAIAAALAEQMATFRRSEDRKQFISDMAHDFAMQIASDGGDERHLRCIPALAWDLAEDMQTEREKRGLEPSV